MSDEESEASGSESPDRDTTGGRNGNSKNKTKQAKRRRREETSRSPVRSSNRGRSGRDRENANDESERRGDSRARGRKKISEKERRLKDAAKGGSGGGGGGGGAAGSGGGGGKSEDAPPFEFEDDFKSITALLQRAVASALANIWPMFEAGDSDLTKQRKICVNMILRALCKGDEDRKWVPTDEWLLESVLSGTKLTRGTSSSHSNKMQEIWSPRGIYNSIQAFHLVFILYSSCIHLVFILFLFLLLMATCTGKIIEEAWLSYMAMSKAKLAQLLVRCLGLFDSTRLEHFPDFSKEAQSVLFSLFPKQPNIIEEAGKLRKHAEMGQPPQPKHVKVSVGNLVAHNISHLVALTRMSLL